MCFNMIGQIYRDNYADYQVIYYEDDPSKKSFCIIHKYYTFELYSDKIKVNNKGIISIIDRRMIETLNSWLAENTELSDDNIYLFIRIKSTNNEDFLKWWNYYNFKIIIESKEELMKKMMIDYIIMVEKMEKKMFKWS